MNIRKAVITAAGRGQRTLPLQTLVDRDGIEKKALRIVIEEVISAGVDEVCLVIAPGDKAGYMEAAGEYATRLCFVEQDEPRGYGHAVAIARDFTGNGAFLHLVGDHLYLSRGPLRCAQQVLEQARAEGCAVSAVQPTREHMLPLYGTVGGHRLPRRPGVYQIERVVEKPTPSEAEQKLLVPGLRAGYYLCLFGIHVFTPAVMDLLADAVSPQPSEPPASVPQPARQAAARSQADGSEPVQLSPILDQLAHQERYLALEVQGMRYNIGIRYGLLIAQLAFALDGADRENVLAQLVELLALRR
jgi:UTP--glucose-1-phosphate uridylyltransferase